jgi:hypothetical protein
MHVVQRDSVFTVYTRTWEKVKSKKFTFLQYRHTYIYLPCIQRHIGEFDRREEPERDLWYQSWGSRGGANCDPSDTFARCFPECFLAPRTIRIFEYAPWCTGKTSQASVSVMCGVCHVWSLSCVCVCVCVYSWCVYTVVCVCGRGCTCLNTIPVQQEAKYLQYPHMKSTSAFHTPAYTSSLRPHILVD